MYSYFIAIIISFVILPLPIVLNNENQYVKAKKLHFLDEHKGIKVYRNPQILTIV